MKKDVKKIKSKNYSRLIIVIGIFIFLAIGLIFLSNLTGFNVKEVQLAPGDYTGLPNGFTPVTGYKSIFGSVGLWDSNGKYYEATDGITFVDKTTEIHTTPYNLPTNVKPITSYSYQFGEQSVVELGYYFNYYGLHNPTGTFIEETNFDFGFLSPTMVYWNGFERNVTFITIDLDRGLVEWRIYSPLTGIWNKPGPTGYMTPPVPTLFNQYYPNVSYYYDFDNAPFCEVTLFGDANDDGIVNTLDTTYVQTAITSGNNDDCADINEDGVVNNADKTIISDIIAGTPVTPPAQKPSAIHAWAALGIPYTHTSPLIQYDLSTNDFVEAPMPVGLPTDSVPSVGYYDFVRKKIVLWYGTKVYEAGENLVFSLVYNGLPPDITSRLIAHYNLDGDAQDSSGNAHHGTVNGATLITDKNGNTDYAYSFDGTNDYITFGDINEIEIVNDVTFSAWVNPTAMQNNNFIASKGCGTGSGWTIGLNQENYLSLDVESTTGDIFGQRLNLNEWKHVAFTFSTSNSGEIKLYIDGVLQGTATISSYYNPPSSQSFNLGACNSGGNNYGFFNGKIDEVKIFDRTLSASEISALYSNGVTPPPPEEEENLNGRCAQFDSKPNCENPSGGYDDEILENIENLNRAFARANDLDYDFCTNQNNFPVGTDVRCGCKYEENSCEEFVQITTASGHSSCTTTNVRLDNVGEVCGTEGAGEYYLKWDSTGDPDAGCVEGVQTFQCPSKVNLPFFTIFNLMISLMTILGIYFLMRIEKR